MAREEHLRELEEKYENYTVYDNQGSKIGKVDDLFVDETDQEEYIGVKMGFFGLKSTLIPTEIVRINEHDRTIEVAESKDRVKDAPNFDDDEDITAEYEERIRSHFGLDSLESSGRGTYSGAATAGGATAETEDRDRETPGTGHDPSGTDAEREHESSGYDDRADDEGDRTRGEDTGRSETTGSTFETTGSTRDTETHQATSAGDAGETENRERYEEAGTASGHQDTSAHGASEQESSSSQPSNTRQTEETETFQEGGRTKVRRRIVREEVIDTDEQ